MSALTPVRPPEIYYPDSDGKPMAESDVHIRQLINLRFALLHHFSEDPLVYVGANMFVYYVEGQSKKNVAPDVFVVIGVAKRDRTSYKIWQEGKAPALVIELTSESTREEDLGNKRVIYADMGVREYFIFDPLKEYLIPRLRGYILVGDEFVPMNGGPLFSNVLGLEFRVDEEQLRLYNPQRGEYLLFPDELQLEIEHERLRVLELEQQADQERERATLMEGQADQERARAAQLETQAEHERARADQLETEAEQERARADQLAQENARLRAELERLRGQS